MAYSTIEEPHGTTNNALIFPKNSQIHIGQKIFRNSIEFIYCFISFLMFGIFCLWAGVAGLNVRHDETVCLFSNFTFNINSVNNPFFIYQETHRNGWWNSICRQHSTIQTHANVCIFTPLTCLWFCTFVDYYCSRFMDGENAQTPNDVGFVVAQVKHEI